MVISNSFATFLILLSILKKGTFWIDNAKAIFSYPVKVSRRLKSWKIKPNSSLRKLFKSSPFNLVISVSPKKICPEVTLSIVEIQFNNVVFPLPLAPIIATNSFFATENDKPSRAFVKLDFVP